jgi:Fe-S oxidoreductase
MPLEKYKNIIHRCYRCGYCKFSSDYAYFNCPTYNKYYTETHAPGGMLWLIRAMMMKEIEITPQLANILYTCTMCANCVDKCPIEFNKDIVNMMVAGRGILVEQSIIPKLVNQYLKNLFQHGNPWRESQSKRGDWARDTGIQTYNQQNEYLLHIGDIGSYDPRVKKVARCAAKILKKAGVNFGILGAEEHTDGNDIRQLGEQGLFHYFAEKNLRVFQDKKVKKICTLSPHAYNTLKNDYPGIGGKFEVFHYTHLLEQCIAQNRIVFKKSPGKKVTFHDPCFLGRWNNEYETPRAILKGIPTVELVEMERNKKDAFCCGGGGGNFYTDLVGSGKNSPARIRIQEAISTGANILAVACPGCMTMLEDALKAENLEDKIEVKDIAEICWESMEN